MVWDLADSTYSAAAASWAAHRSRAERGEGRSAEQRGGEQRQARPWHGVFEVAKGCMRLPDEEVEPPVQPRLLGRLDWV